MAHPFIPFADTCKVQMIFSQYGQRLQNGYYFHNTAGSFGVAEMGLLAAYMKNWWDTNLKSLVTQDCSLVQIDCKDMTSQNAPGINYTTGLPIVGTAATEGNPTNVTVAIKLTTGLSGRSYRGRIFHIGLPQTTVTADAVDNNVLTALHSAYSILQSAPLTDWELVVASQYTNGAWRTSGVVTPVEAIAGDGYLDSQRRRLIGRGR